MNNEISDFFFFICTPLLFDRIKDPASHLLFEVFPLEDSKQRRDFLLRVCLSVFTF